MNQVTSKDGTVIVFEKSGQGPAVIVVGGILGDRSQQAPLAARGLRWRRSSPSSSIRWRPPSRRW